MCTCVTPGVGTSGQNGYTCTFGDPSHCRASEECYAHTPFERGKPGDGCRVPVPAPECSDLIENGDETGVDCGGSCGACSGTVWTWGDNDDGQLGDGTLVNRASAETVTRGCSAFSDIATGFRHSGAICSDGSLWTWGMGFYGQVGSGNKFDQAFPVQITTQGCSAFSAIKMGGYHSAAICSDGTLWMWGMGFYGQLGTGAGGDRVRPVQVAVPGCSAFTALAMGGYHSAVVCANGALWTWGRNDAGQLGDGTEIQRDRPVLIPVLGCSNVSHVALGEHHSAARCSDGTLWMWGGNDDGQLGDGTVADQARPVRVTAPGCSAFAGIAMGGRHSAALCSDGTLWVWGRGLYGQVGSGTTADQARPLSVTVQGCTAFASVALGHYHSAAICSADGALWMWGRNDGGQLGDGAGLKTSPARVASPVCRVAKLSLGAGHSAALCTGMFGSACASQSPMVDVDGCQKVVIRIIAGRAGASNTGISWTIAGGCPSRTVHASALTPPRDHATTIICLKGREYEFRAWRASGGTPVYDDWVTVALLDGSEKPLIHEAFPADADFSHSFKVPTGASCSERTSSVNTADCRPVTVTLSNMENDTRGFFYIAGACPSMEVNVTQSTYPHNTTVCLKPGL